MNEKLFNSDYLLHLCQKYYLQPNKKYGQNFLIDPEPIGVMLVAGEVNRGDTVVEVGPGFGVLTFALAEAAEKVIGFEIEKKLQTYWNDEIKKMGNLEIVWGNVLKECRNKVGVPEFGKYKVVANLPYQITSNFIRTFLELDNKPESMVLMIQKEVAERICAQPGDNSVLSVSVQYYADTEIQAQVPRKMFWPEPAVDSAIIKIVPKVGVKNDDNFFRIVKAGFAQKRKLLIKNLLPIVGKKNKTVLEDIFVKMGYNNNVRAQELSLENWRTLAKEFPSQP